jgi:hypothetical protein
MDIKQVDRLDKLRIKIENDFQGELCCIETRVQLNYNPVWRNIKSPPTTFQIRFDISMFLSSRQSLVIG